MQTTHLQKTFSSTSPSRILHSSFIPHRSSFLWTWQLSTINWQLTAIALTPTGGLDEYPCLSLPEQPLTPPKEPMPNSGFGQSSLIRISSFGFRVSRRDNASLQPDVTVVGLCSSSKEYACQLRLSRVAVSSSHRPPLWPLCPSPARPMRPGRTPFASA